MTYRDPPKIKEHPEHPAVTKQAKEFKEISWMWARVVLANLVVSVLLLATGWLVLGIVQLITAFVWLCFMLMARNVGYQRLAEVRASWSPGGTEATKIGCTCPVMDNQHGWGYRYEAGKTPSHIIVRTCHVHGD